MNKQGFLIFFDEGRRKDLIKDFYLNGQLEPFSEALSVLDLGVKEYDIAFLSFEVNKIDYMALARKGNRVVTSKNKIEFTNLLNLKSIDIKLIDQRMDTRIRNYFIKSSQGIGDKLTTKTFEKLIEIIKELRPNLKEKIDIILKKKNLIDKKFNDSTRTALFLQEKDALGTALDIFSGTNKLREKVFESWSPKNTEELNENTYFEGLKNQYQKDEGTFFLTTQKKTLSEEDTLEHDLFNWPNMTAKHTSGYTHFYNGKNKLDVFYANRNALEKTVGVDLIYYNMKYNSFVLVQYKLMEKEQEGFVYRPDKQIDKEIKRMNAFNSKIILSNTISDHNDMRLNNNGFMIKLVPNKSFEPISNKLISGMYLTLEYANFLLGNNGPKGKNGGRLLTYDNSPRYITTTDFINLVNQGFIGTNGLQSDKIQDLIKEFYETNRAIIFAKEYGL